MLTLRLKAFSILINKLTAQPNLLGMLQVYFLAKTIDMLEILLFISFLYF